MRTAILSVILLLPGTLQVQNTRPVEPAQSTSHANPELSKTEFRAGQTFHDCADCPEMVVFPGGTFTMGSPMQEAGHDDQEGPQQGVTVQRFAIGKFDVTRGQWAAFVSPTNRSTTGGCAWASSTRGDPDPKASWRNLDFMQDDRHPAVCVTWGDAQDYVRWLSQLTNRQYRLPTEAEWEYAARAGSTTAYPWGTAVSHEYANYGTENCCAGLASGRDEWINTSPVGSFPPNAFGLYDMHGNVLQWVQDCFSNSYAKHPADGSAFEDGSSLNDAVPFKEMKGASACSYRMLRGGDWGDPPQMIRSAFRNLAPPPGSTLKAYKSGGVGFRVARTLN